jgi:CheY-like chemotaxis protein
MPKTVLLADDSVTIQKVVSISFANEDIELHSVDNGDDAVTRARELRPDLILADVVMPRRSGYDVCEAIKSDPALRHVPVVLLTGTFEVFDEERARRVGADDHITKPFEAQVLVDRVNALLARAAAAPAAAPPGRAAADDEPYAFFDGDLTHPGRRRPAEPAAPAPANAPGSSPPVREPAPAVAAPTPAAVAAPTPPAFAAPAPAALAAPVERPAATLTATTVLEVPDDEGELFADVEPEARAAAAPDPFSDDEIGALEVDDLDAPASAEVEIDLGATRSAYALDDPEPAAPRSLDPFDDGLDFAFGESAGDTPRPSAADSDPLAGLEVDDLAGDAGVDTSRARAFDVSMSDLADPLASTASALRPAPSIQPPVEPAVPSASDPLLGTPRPETTAPELTRLSHTGRAAVFDEAYPFTSEPDPFALPEAEEAGGLDLPAEPIISPSGRLDESARPIASPPAPAPAIPFDDAFDSLGTSRSRAPSAFDLASEPWEAFEEPARPASPAREPARSFGASQSFARPPVADVTEPTAPAAPMPRLPDLEPILRERIHDTLEKIAWEAFADLSNTVVRQALERIESIAWEVIPQLAEALIREEIRKLRSEQE